MGDEKKVAKNESIGVVHGELALGPCVYVFHPINSGYGQFKLFCKTREFLHFDIKSINDKFSNFENYRN